MEPTTALARDAGPNDALQQDGTLRKAEKNRKKKERKKLSKKRKAGKAVDLVEQAPTHSQVVGDGVNPESSAPGVAAIHTPTLASYRRENHKSSQAHHSQTYAQVALGNVSTHTAASKSIGVEEHDTGKAEEGRYVKTRSAGHVGTVVFQSFGDQPTGILTSPSDNDTPVISPSRLSVSECENSIVMAELSEVDSDDDSIEETIMTQGAKATLFRLSKPVAPKQHLQALDLSVDQDDSDDEDVSALGDSDPRDCEPEQIKPKRHAGFPAPEDLPNWFPRNIKQIYRVNRHGGALAFKELNEITRYRAALERIRRQKWSTYIQAGEARWKLQRILRRLRVRPLTKPFYDYRNKQYKFWKRTALKSWKRLEKTQLGVSILDETIDINFRQERMIYGKKLGGRL